MRARVDAIVVVEWWVIDVGLREGEGRNRRRRANGDTSIYTPTATASPICVESTAAMV